MASLGEMLPCTREESNSHDPFAVAVRDGANIVGHMPSKFSALCALFIQHGGTITCRVIGSKIQGISLKEDLRFPVYSPFLENRRKYKSLWKRSMPTLPPIVMTLIKNLRAKDRKLIS